MSTLVVKSPIRYAFFQGASLIPIRLVTAGVVLSLSGAAWCQVANSIYGAAINGGFVTSGVSTRVWGGAQVDPFTLAIGGIPNGAAVVKAYANWSYQSNLDDPGAEQQIFIDGNMVMGNLSGLGTPDLIWGRNHTTAYTADVTALIGGNGNYTIRSAVDEWNGVGALGEGLSITVVWQHANAPLRWVELWDGFHSTTSHLGPWLLPMGQAYQGGTAHFFINAIDGQEMFTDEFFLNGQMASGWGGTGGVLGNAWRGVEGPGAIGSNFYDYAEGDASAFLGVGQNGMTAYTLGAGNTGFLTDAVGHSFAAVSFAVPEPGLLVGLGCGLIGLIGRRRKLK